jgi:putative ABC transport system substrate-binding protein
MERKYKVASLVTGSILLISICAVQAQQTNKVFRIGYLGNERPAAGSTEKDPFFQALRNYGWIEGQNIVIERRYWDNQIERLPAIADELVRLKVDLIVTSTGQGGRYAMKATSTIPIVLAGSGDAVAYGLVASLAQPGGNVTGVTSIAPDVNEKQLKLLKEAFPMISRVAVLMCPVSGSPNPPQWSATNAAARVLKIDLLPLEIRGPDDIMGAFRSANRERADALFVLNCMRIPPAETVDRANRSRLPAMYSTRSFVRAGGLMMYGANQRELSRQAAVYVDKILRGAKPADLPVQQPLKFELVVNLKTAREIGVKIPPEVLMWADQVIQ